MILESNGNRNENTKNMSFGFEIGNRECVNSEESLSKILLNQIEYYFSDLNLMNDNFLKNEIKKHKKGFVDLRIFLKFKRVKWLFRTFSVDYDLQLEKLSEVLQNSQELVLNKQKNMIKRRIPYKLQELDLELEHSRINCSIYLETVKPDVTISDIFKIFNDNFKIEKVNLPMNRDRNNKGYAVITFIEKESVDKAIKYFETQRRKPIILTNFVDSEFTVTEYFKIKEIKNKVDQVS